MASERLFYIQNRGFSGDCLLWWRDGGHGYTVDLNQAWKVDSMKAAEICLSRPGEDHAWPVEEVDAAAQRHLNSESEYATKVLRAQRRKRDGRGKTETRATD